MKINNLENKEFTITFSLEELQMIRYMMGYGYSNLLGVEDKKEMLNVLNPIIIILGKEPFEIEED